MNVMVKIFFGVILLLQLSCHVENQATCSPQCDSSGSSFCSSLKAPNCTCAYPKSVRVIETRNTVQTQVCYDASTTVAPLTAPTTPFQLDKDTGTSVKNANFVLIVIYCIWLGAVIVAFAAICKFVAPDRVIHLNEEITLIATFLLAMFFWDGYKTDFCKGTSVLLQYLFLCSLTFFCLEALHTYSLVTFIVPKNGFFPILANIAIGYGLPLIIMGFSIGFLWGSYGNNGRHCWCDLGTDQSWAFLFPIGFFTFACLVIAEAQRLGSYRQLPDTDKNQLKTAKYSEGSLLFVVPVTVATYIFGLIAVDLQMLAYWIIFFILITIDGPLIFFAHGMAHPKLRRLFAKCFPCCRDRSTQNQYEKVVPTTSDDNRNGWPEQNNFRSSSQQELLLKPLQPKTPQRPVLTNNQRF